MQENEIALTHEIYSEHLREINGIEVSYREIDVIACLVVSKTPGEIAQFLDIDKRTVSTHIKNIKKSFNLSSTKQIEDFIRNSDKFELIKNKYLQSLFIRAKFETQLKKFSRIVKHEKPFCYEINQQDQNNVNSLINQLKNHLKYAGISARQKTTQGYKPFSQLLQNVNKDISYTLYFVAQDLTNNSIKIGLSINLKSKNGVGEVIIAQQKDTIPIDASKQSRKVQQTLSLENESYYFAIFSMLKELYPNINTGQLISDFKEAIKRPLNLSENNSGISTATQYGFFKILKLYKKLVLSGCFILSSTIGVSLLKSSKHNPTISSQEKIIQKGQPIRSELPLPANAIQRLELMTQIDKKLKAQQGIQALSLVGVVGMGGVGKTTLARQFGRLKSNSTVWELNAETKESLVNSFQDLAYALAETKEKKEELSFIQNIKNLDEREKQIIAFVKQNLKIKDNWLLIYDNVESFPKIKEYFPHNPHIWGSGKVIITTRNSNIKNTSYIKSGKIIYIEELTKLEALNLFSKILYNCNSEKLTVNKKHAALTFLQNIPPFPLDISLAAYYLKATDISYEKYLKHLKAHDRDFAVFQEDLIKETSQYSNTRYNIVTLSINQIIEKHKDFRDLLLFISLLESQEIPRDLLETYKSEFVLENFIYNLKKYSLISTKIHPISTISIHRSTQDIMLAYLIKIMNLKQNTQILELILNVLDKYISKIIESEDFDRMKILINHLENLLSHNQILSNSMRGIIEGKLGSIYCNLSYYIKAKHTLESSILNLNKYCKGNHAQIAQTLGYLGTVYRELGNFGKAKIPLEQSLAIYKEHLPRNYNEIAKITTFLGTIYRELGEFPKAIELFEQSLSIYKQNFSDNHIGVARILTYLGSVYREQGKYQHAKHVLNQSLMIYKSYPENHIWTARSLVHLGTIYKELGNYQKAQDLLEQTLLLYKQYVHESYVGVPWALIQLANVYKEIGNYEKAKSLIEQSLAIYEKDFSEDYFDIALALSYLGDVYKELGNYEKARDLLEKSLNLFKQYHYENHVRAAWAPIYLGSVYVRLGNYEKAKTLLEHSLKTQERNYGLGHIETARVLKELGDLHLMENKLEQAENYINIALRIFEKTKHPESHNPLESLGKLNLKKAFQLEKERSFVQAKLLKDQAIQTLKQAAAIARKHFPSNSAHIIRIQNQLKDAYSYNVP